MRIQCDCNNTFCAASDHDTSLHFGTMQAVQITTPVTNPWSVMAIDCSRWFLLGKQQDTAQIVRAFEKASCFYLPGFRLSVRSSWQLAQHGPTSALCACCSLLCNRKGGQVKRSRAPWCLFDIVWQYLTQLVAFVNPQASMYSRTPGSQCYPQWALMQGLDEVYNDILPEEQSPYSMPVFQDNSLLHFLPFKST